MSRSRLRDDIDWRFAVSPRFLASHRLQAGSVVRAAAAMLLFSAPLSAQTRPGPAVTFTKDVAPILQRSCVTCHRPGTIRSDVVADLRGSAPVGALDQDACHGSGDAAVAHR